MDNRNRRNDRGTAAVLMALLAGIGALGVLGGAVFFLADSEEKTDAQVSAQSEQDASQCDDSDIACLAEEAGLSEQAYLHEVCEALAQSDCGETASSAANGNENAASTEANDADESESGDEPPADDEEDAAEEEDEDEPEADPEEEPEDGGDDGIIDIDPELLYCFFDADSDGLFNCEESTHGTDPNNWDTDGDGLGDGLEVGSGLGDPTLFDTDNDALSDFQEMTWGTNPWSSDSDGDGYSDSNEIFWGSDPTDPDDEPFDIDWL